MSRGLIQHVYIADGFADDCEELIHRCSQVDILNYQTFCNIWKDMQFAYMYHGRSSGAEIAELSEECLRIAKHYMVAKTSSFCESVAALFTIYALLNLQPFKGFANLRLVPEDVPALKKIEAEGRRDRRYDVLYVLSWILSGPTHCHVVSREMGFEPSLRHYLKGFRAIDENGVRPRGVLYRQSEELDALRELSSLHNKYNQAKLLLQGSKNPDRNLEYTNPKLATELEGSLKTLITGTYNNDNDSEIGEDGDLLRPRDHYSAVQDIKRKAMKGTVNKMKHLVTVTGDKKPQSPKETEVIKTQLGKTKNNSPKKKLTCGSPRKRKLVTFAKKRTPTKRKLASKSKRLKKRRDLSDSESEDDDEISLYSDTDVSLEEDELDIDHFIREPVPVNLIRVNQPQASMLNNDMRSIIIDADDRIQESDISEISQIIEGNVKNKTPFILKDENSDCLIEIEIVDDGAIENVDVDSKSMVVLNEPESVKGETFNVTSSEDIVETKNTSSAKTRAKLRPKT